MAPFSSPRDRDAWATIRGFVYQVDLTIARWLELDDLQALELEAGEDIDLVASALVADDTRELEQVKVREGGLSLRSGEAIEAIGNARAHLAENPTILLRFRFTTTAHVAREQGHPDSGRPAGIDLWEGTRTGTRGPSETAGDFGVIQTLLASASRPKSLPVSLWDAAQAVAADPAALADLVARFEWSMGALSPEDRSKSVLAALVAGGYAENEPRARAVYERLFAFVFRLLTREGTKRLTKGELGTIIARSDLTESERALLSRVRDRLALVQVRVEALEGRVDRLEERLASAFGLPGAAIALGVPGLDVEPPPLADPLSERAQVVTALKEIDSPWLALEGDAGTGKSHLALLTARARGRQLVWLRLAGSTGGADAAARVVRALAAWTQSASLDTSVVVERSARRLHADAASVVIDDLPELGRDDPLARVLFRLLDAVGGYPLSLITTSAHPLPSTFTATASARCVRRPCPPFNEAETVELFAAYGGAALVARSPKALSTLVALTRGHPTLLRAMAAFLRERSWVWDQETFDGVFHGTYAADTFRETRAALAASVPDPGALDLLERLKLHAGDFAAGEVHALARVDPVIDNPMARLRVTEGVWLQQTSASRWRLSPLLSSLPRATLAPDVERACHAALAEERLRHVLDQNSGASLIVHLFAADEPERAAFILGMLIDELVREGSRVDPGILLAIAWDMPLPSKMSVGAQLFVRRAQLRAAAHYKKDDAFLSNDIDLLLARATEQDAWAVVLIEVGRFERFFETDPERAAKSFAHAVSVVPSARLPDGTPYPIPDLSPLIWLRSNQLRTPRHLRAWLGLVQQLPRAAREWRDDANGMRATTACQLAANEIWTREQALPAAEAQLARAHSSLDEIVRTAQAMDFPYLEACALCGKIALLWESGGKREDALAVATEFLTRHAADASCEFLIEDVLGRQYWHAGDPAQALGHLRRALDIGAAREPHLACLTANYASRAAASTEPGAALQFAERAAALARSDPTVPIGTLLIATAEVAIAHWHEGDARGCCAALLSAAELFNKHVSEESFSRTVGVPFVRVVHMLTMLVTGDARSGKTSDTPVPPRGFFYGSASREGLEWRSDLGALIAFDLCRVASTLEDEVKAFLWAERGLADAEHRTEHSLAPMLLTTMLAFTLLSERDDAALTLAARTEGLARAARARPHEGSPVHMEAPSGPLASFSVIPLAIGLATSAIDARENASALARQCAARFTSLARDSVHSETWVTMASLIEAPYGGASWRDLVARANTWTSDADAAPRMLSYFQASACEEIPLETAASMHVQLIPTLWHQCGGLAGHRIVERFVERFWTRAFGRSRFAFNAPREMERTIRDVAHLAPGTRARRLLEAVAVDQHINASTEVRRWFHEDGS